jgi:two-component system, cell cycle response regulator DivK
MSMRLKGLRGKCRRLQPAAHIARFWFDKGHMTVSDNIMIDDDPSGAALPDVPKGTKGAGKRILIVDDDADTRWLLGHLLISEGFEVQMAEYAEGAMMVLYNFSPDGVLMDVRLPGMDGLQLTRLIRLTRSKNVPIVAVSAGDTAFSIQEAYEAGCDGYISKPVDADTFASTVRQYLDSHAAWVQGSAGFAKKSAR